MLSSLGQALLYAALGAAVYNVLGTAWAFRRQGERQAAILATTHNAALAVWGALTAACVVLMTLFVTNDFSVAFVRDHSALGQAFAYKLSALWGGQEGSLLLWSWILACYGLAVARSTKRERLIIGPAAVSVITVVSIFFISLIAFIENPFTRVVGAVPIDGRGLNPLLQNYWMQIHPPTLYAGYVGCTVPFAFAVAALLHGRFDDDWVGIVRRWTLVPWLVLTIGIIMGGAWAYETLGWGGYWAWDPVENASLMPWLTATAFLHSIMIQARRGMLRSWNMILVSLTFLLSIFGTFLTRSGVVASIHSFANSGIGTYFMVFLSFCLVASFGLIIWRRNDLASTAHFESALSREGAFLLNNWILLGAAFAVLWGTVYPTISETLTGNKVSVGAPYFNSVMVPLGLVLLALTGIGPLMAWRRTSPRALLRVARVPVLLAVAFSPILFWLGRWHTGAGTSFCLCLFVTAAIVGEWVRGARARRSMTGEQLGSSFINLVRKNKQRYGGYVVHLGVVVFFIGVTGSSAFKIEKEPIKLKLGETMKIGEYTLKYVGLERATPPDADKSDQFQARIHVLSHGRRVGELLPGVDIYKPAAVEKGQEEQPGQQARRPKIMSNLANDLYLVLTGFETKDLSVEIKAYLNPLVMWIWISTLFFIGGSVIAWFPEPRRDRVREAHVVRRDTASATRAAAPGLAAAVAAGEEGA